ncbi:MAG TPA: hypothetical protein VK858_05860 [Longimicrobiales bacterium]|nr:hypothetical protein [Longimicrobiales bacterium]
MRAEARRRQMFRRTCLRWVALACTVIVNGGCAMVVGGLIEGAVGEKPGQRSGAGLNAPPLYGAARPLGEDVARSVYLRGPTPGWEYEVARFSPRAPSTLVRVDFFHGRCPGLHFTGWRPDGPFDRGTEAFFGDVGIAHRLPADVPYLRFGAVVLVGAPAALAGEILAWLPERGPGTCISIGLPLVTFGRTGGRSALR